jgi:ABC-2 type transport system ATP-binding protein
MALSLPEKRYNSRMVSPVYLLEQVHKTYPGQKEPANRDISLEILPGEIFGFLGDNGAGKTTLVRQITRLSGGQRRLLRLAVAMIGSPPVVILDEPTTDLDPQHRNLVWERLRCENTERGVTVLFITHDAIEAEKVIQRVGIMKQGRLVAVGSPAVLKRLVDQKLRLEIIFPIGSPPVLPLGLEIQQVQPGRCLVYLERSEAASVLECLDLSKIDDFRLFSATLEDQYLYYTNQSA